jgi:5-keto 4-deoxyuronate isomerase
VPQVRKLVQEEVDAIVNKGKGLRKLTEEQYDRALADFNVGDYGEIIPDPEENRLTARNRLKAAAGRRNFTLQFLRTTGDAMRFYVEPGNSEDGAQQQVMEVVPEPQPEPEPASVAPPKKRGGRPKKVVD